MENAAIGTYVQNHTAEAVSLLKELGRIPAPTRSEDLRAAFVRDWFVRNGLPAEIDGAKNVIVCLEAGSPMTAYLAHTDVVFPDTEPLPMREDGPILFAPGIGDDTANLVHLMLGARYLFENRSRLKKSVLIAANACEEGLGNLDGCRALFDRFGGRIDAFYSFDCGFGQVICKAVGSHRYRVTVRAKGGHSFSAFGSENAIHTASRLICSLYEIEPYRGAKTTFNVGTISGGTTVNSIAETAEFLYEYRSESEEGLAFMKKEMETVLDRFRAAGHAVETELLGVRPGTGALDQTAFDRWTEHNIELIRPFAESFSPSAEAVRLYAEAGRANERGQIRTRSASTDANIPLSRGIFANTIGTAVTCGAHTRGEWVDLTSVPAGLGIALMLMSECLRAED